MGCYHTACLPVIHRQAASLSWLSWLSWLAAPYAKTPPCLISEEAGSENVGELPALTAWLRISSLSLLAHRSPPHPVGPLPGPHSLDIPPLPTVGLGMSVLTMRPGTPGGPGRPISP